jgi:hypothetical protein
MFCSVFYFFSFFLLRRTRRLYVYGARFDRFQTKICKTNPIFKKPKIDITDCIAKRYDKILGLTEMQKRTQTNPILSCQKSSQTQTKPILSALVADKIAPLFRMSFILRGPARYTLYATCYPYFILTSRILLVFAAEQFLFFHLTASLEGAALPAPYPASPSPP